MRTFAISAMGLDRPGIIAAVAGPLAAHGVNVADSHLGVLRGRFTMMLEVTAPEGVDAAALERDLAASAAGIGLEAVSLHEVAGPAPPAPDRPTHSITVRGADHPGILAAVSAALAAEGANVCDLETRLAEGTWTMLVEATVPDPARLRHRLEAVAAQQAVEVVLRSAASQR